MPRPLSFWFGLYSVSLGALGCVLVFFFLLPFLSLVCKLKSFCGALNLGELVLPPLASAEKSGQWLDTVCIDQQILLTCQSCERDGLPPDAGTLWIRT